MGKQNAMKGVPEGAVDCPRFHAGSGGCSNLDLSAEEDEASACGSHYQNMDGSSAVTSLYVACKWGVAEEGQEACVADTKDMSGVKVPNECIGPIMNIPGGNIKQPGILPPDNFPEFFHRFNTPNVSRANSDGKLDD